MAMAIQKRPGFARPHPNKAWLRFGRRIPLLAMVIPGLIFLVVFNYYPMLGLQVAFKDFSFNSGIWRSPWTGLDNFYFLYSSDFWQSVVNTFTLTFGRLILGFPAPIILALIFNEIRSPVYKRLVQTISYMPYFVSWVVVAGILQAFLNMDNGVINQVLRLLGMHAVNYLGKPEFFKVLFWGSSFWVGTGFGTVIYLAAIAGINPELYEAASMDGAGRLAQIRHITLPCLMPTISILLVLNMPGLLSAGYNQILPLMNAGNQSAAEVIDTYIVRMGLGQGQYAFTTALTLIMSILSLFVVTSSSYVSGRLGGTELF